jgi:hypothetical protein
MAIQHAVITDPDLHEPKGVATATVGQVYVADGSGSGDWYKLVEKKAVSAGTPAEVAANTTAEHAITVSGATTSDFVIGVSKPTHQAGLGIVGWRVSAADTVTITYMNTTAAGITPTASETYQVFLFKAA